MDIEIQKISNNDLHGLTDLIEVFVEVFEMEDFVYPGKNHLGRLLQKENFFAVTAKIDNIVVGGLTVYVIDQYYSTKPLAYIYDLAVLTAFQRKGIGKKLIDFTNNYCRQKGFEEVFVQADKVDGYALDFYRSTQPTNEEQVVHFYYIFNGNQKQERFG